MNLTDFMQGKITKSGCYGLIGAGIYSMSMELGQLLLPPVDYAVVLHGLLGGMGFKYFMAGWIFYGLRRAMAKGGAEKPPLTEEEVTAKMQELQDAVADASTVLANFKEKVK